MPSAKPPTTGSTTPSTAGSTTSAAAPSSSSCSGCTKTTWSAMSSPKSSGRSCAFRRSPKRTRCTGSRRSGDHDPLPAGRVKPCIPSASRSRPSSGFAGPIGEYNFAGQYQQSPAPLGGGMVKAEWFKRYGANEQPESFDRIVQSGIPPTRRPSSAISASARAGGSEARTSISSTCCASGSNIRR